MNQFLLNEPFFKKLNFDTNAAGTNKIESASTSVKAGTGGNPVDESDLVLTEIPDEDVPVDERTNTQGSENTEESGTGGYNPPPEGGGVPIPAIPVRPTKEEIANEDTSDFKPEILERLRLESSQFEEYYMTGKYLINELTVLILSHYWETEDRHLALLLDKSLHPIVYHQV